MFQVMKGKDLHPRLLYPAKLPFRMEGQIKCFPGKVNLKEFIITKPLLYEMLKGLIYEKEDDHFMRSKMTKNSQLSTTEPKKNPQLKLSKLEQEQNHGNREHMEGYQWGGMRGEWRKRYRE